MIKLPEYRAVWGISLALLKKNSGFYDANVERLYKEGLLVKRFNEKLNQYRLYDV